MTQQNQRTIGLTKAPHIYKSTQAQTQKQTFVKECCLQTLPKPIDTIKTIPFDKSASIQQGVCQNTGGRKLSSTFCNSIVLHIGLDIYYLAFVCYLHLQFFNHHRYRADGILIPVLRQALSVACNFHRPQL